MRFPSRAPAPPAEVLERAGLDTGERPLAHAQARDGSWLIGTRGRLLLVLAGVAAGDAVVSLPWEQVEAADWDRDAERLRVSEVGEYGRPRASYAFDVGDPRLLLQLVRERVTHSVVLQRRVAVRGRKGFSVIGRRNPVGGHIRWMHEYDLGVDPTDPEVQRLADAALREARAEVGE
ncbi:MAG TPA: hypothetical protein VFL69_14745 [Marmoricola sp.]|nr:hypothetical protein [Marmoricola sp.]